MMFFLAIHLQLTCNPDSLLNFISQMLHRYRSSGERHTSEPPELLDIPAYTEPSFTIISEKTEASPKGKAGFTVSGLCSLFIFIPTKQ